MGARFYLSVIFISIFSILFINKISKASDILDETDRGHRSPAVESLVISSEDMPPNEYNNFNYNINMDEINSTGGAQMESPGEPDTPSKENLQ